MITQTPAVYIATHCCWPTAARSAYDVCHVSTAQVVRQLVVMLTKTD